MEERTRQIELTHLGKVSNEPVYTLDLIPWNRGAITVRFDCEEFTSLCPVTGQPDFGQLLIQYVPARHLIETKSLKLFLAGFRNARAFNEEIVVSLANEIFDQAQPVWVTVTGRFNARGGISLTATAERGEK